MKEEYLTPMPRVYMINFEQTKKNPFEMSDKAFITLAKKHNQVYTLAEFESMFNEELVSTGGDYIRIR